MENLGLVSIKGVHLVVFLQGTELDCSLTLEVVKVLVPWFVG